MSILSINLNKIHKSETSRIELCETINDLNRKGAVVTFNLAVASADALGITIPTYTMEDGTEVKSETYTHAFNSQKELVEATTLTKGTVSKMIKAIESVIDGGHFDDFANGTYQFDFGKIYYIADRQDLLLKKYSYGELLKFGRPSLEKIYNDLKKTAENERLTNETLTNKGSNSESESENESEESLPMTDDMMRKDTFEGITYEYSVGEFRKFLAEHGKVC